MIFLLLFELTFFFWLELVKDQCLLYCIILVYIIKYNYYSNLQGHHHHHHQDYKDARPLEKLDEGGDGAEKKLSVSP